MNTYETINTELFELQELTDPKRPITYGVVKPGPEDPETGVVFVRGGDISNGTINKANLRTITQEVSRPYARTILRGGEVVISLVGNPGEVAVVPDSLMGANLARQAGLIALRPEIHAHYIKYFLMSPLGRAELFQRTQGAVQQVINLSDLKHVKVHLPSRYAQVRIADILSSYDDLIQNNRKRIALLEKAAQLLYREWFVDFRFPGHEHVKLTDGLPEGWKRLVPSGLVTNHIGGGWGKEEPVGKEGETAFVIRGTDIPRVESGDISSVGLRFHSATSLRSRVLVPYDVVFEVSGGSSSQPIARTLLLTEERLKCWNTEVICASFCKRLTFNMAADALYFIFHIREYRDRGDVLVYQKESASSLKNFNFDGFMSSYKFSVPPISLRKLFFKYVNPIVHHQSVLATQIQQLTKARDLLLPRLMNGEIVV